MPIKYEPFDWYETPLYYDIIFDEDTDKEADFLETMADWYVETNRRANQPMRFLEPACGSGRLLAEMAARGYDCTGFDLSDPMLAFAQLRIDALDGKGNKGATGSSPASAKAAQQHTGGQAASGTRSNLKTRLVNADMADFAFKQKFDLAYCGVSTFKYLQTEADARAHLQCMAKALKQGGVYVLGFHISDYDFTSIQRERWVQQRGKTHVTCNIQSWPPDRKTRTEKVRSRLVVKENGCTRRYETVWTFRTYTARQVRSLLRSVPELEHVNTYDMTYDPNAARDDLDERYDCVLILRKR